jgi:hypothetical protein
MLVQDCRSLFRFHCLGACRHYLQGAGRRAAFLLLFLGAGLVLAQPCVGGSGVFENTGSLGTPRTSHTATLLPNGKVLVAGGSSSDGGDGALASAELYDVMSGTWSATGSLGTARSHQTATLLPNGNVLVAGGYNVGEGGALASAELYDPASGTWTATGNLGTGRYGHAATLLPNGKVLLAEGTGTPTSDLGSAELYDPAGGTWTATGSGNARRYPRATLLPNGKVLFAGGNLPFVGAHPFSQLYDPTSGTWAATGNLTSFRDSHTATLLPDGKVLVAGGINYNPMGSAELYDPANGTWTPTVALATARFRHTATLLPNGRVLVVGGNGPEVSNSSLASAELYDRTSGTWTSTGNLTTAREKHTATLLPNGEVLVAGGYTSGSVNALASAELYLGPATPPTLLNISTRMRVLTDDKVLIGGFIITGTDLKRVLIRGIGPSLNGVGVSLSDPTLELHQGDVTVATNDNWKTRPDGTSQQAEIEATTIPPANDLESAILLALSPGAYTATLSGKNGGTGMGLVEVYDLGQGANSQPANISTRGFVDTDDNVMIGGLIVGGGSGGGTARVIVRALGPSVPVAGALGDPTLELHDGSGTLVASNDNWKVRPDGSSQQAEIEATTIPPTNDLESALVQTLPAGNYTTIVRGKNGTTGVGLVEVYHLQ